MHTPYCNTRTAIPLPPAALEKEISHMENMVTRALKYLHIACNQMHRVEKDLRHFLDGYYVQVGGFFEQLETLRYEIRRYDRYANRSSGQRKHTAAAHKAAQQAYYRDMSRELRGEDIEAEMKRIYRTLVKLYHPDVAQNNSYSHSIIQLINQTYARKNLWAMREMEHSLLEHAHAADDTPERKLFRLRARFEAISESVRRVVQRRRKLERSPAWQLKLRVEQEHYLVGVILRQVKRQIEEARSALLQRKAAYRQLTLAAA